MSDDLAHDAHLRAALRHAPDHALSPPSGLTQSILAAARQAHRPAATSAAPPPMRLRTAGTPTLRTWLRRMVSPRWAGAWAAAGVAALGLGLWVDFGPPPPIETTTVAANDAAPASPPAVPSPAAADTQARIVTKAAAEGPAAADAAAAARSAEKTETSRAGRSEPAQRPQQAAAPREQSAKLQQHEPPAARARDAIDRAAAPGGAGAVAAAPPAIAAPTEPRQAAGGAPLPAAESTAPAGLAPPLAVQQARAPDGSPAPVRNGTARGTRSAPAATADASPTLTLWRRAQDELASGAARWTWSAPGRPTIAPLDADALAWLSRVTQGAQGRWGDADGHAELPAAIEARWWRDGWPYATLRIEPDGVRWVEAGGRARFAPLDPATLQQLRNP